ncbi:hypothetical protein [Massilia endophytica]|uniref:hypothetical protein n=1 Tax=Massilia endophytica TaxID=2899220 RepID=UPI001E3650B1|nr:hypothetical protein [Massilia endophytica]UGQ44746.1 hypothetical protein LSQ66_13130 [Massilia endophytica]
MRYLIVLLSTLTICFAAQARQEEDELPAAEDLMVLAFPKWADDTEGRLQSITLNKMSRAWDGGAPRKAKTRKVIVQPQFVTRLGPKRVSLIAKLLPASDDGTAEAAHVTPLGVAAYIFDTSSSGWKLVARQEPFALHGLFAEAQLTHVELARGRPAVLVEYGSCWQGYCNDWITLYEFNSKGVNTKPVLEQTLKADNLGALHGCPERLWSVLPGLRASDYVDEDEKRLAAERRCISVRGMWRVEPSDREPGDFAIDFKGARSESLRGAPQPAEKIEQSVRFVYRKGKYELESGENPAPAF